MGNTRRGVLAGITTTALAISMVGIVVAPQVALADQQPAGVIGGPGHATVYPSGMEVDPTSGDLVLADTGNDGVVKFTSAGDEVWRKSTLSDDADSLDNARDTAIDGSGNIYVADDAKFRILKLDKNGDQLGNPWTGPTGDKIGSPIGISFKNDLLYVADGAKKKVRVFTTSGTQVRAITQNGVCAFSNLRDVDADAAGNIYVANYLNNDILKLTSTGTCITKWGTQGTANGQFKNPYGIRLANDPVWGESVYVADSNNNRIQIFDKIGNWRASLGSTGSGAGQFTTLRRVAVAADGDVWGADLWGWKAARFDRTATGFTYAQSIGGQGPPTTPSSVFNEPRAVAVGADGTLNIVDTVNQRIVTTSSTGAILGTCGARTNLPTSINWPRGVAIDPVTGDRWVADTKQSRIQIWKTTCGVTARIGTLGSGTGQLNWPYAISIRASDRTAFLADTKNNRIVAWDVAGRNQIAAIGSLGAGDRQFNSPRSVSVSPTTGNLLVSDSKNNRIVELTFSRSTGFSVVRTLTGGYNTPEGAAQDSQGRLWISDTNNNRVVVLSDKGLTEDIITTANGVALSGPTSVTSTSSTTYVSDTQNDRVLTYTTGTVVIPPTQPPAYQRTVHSAGVADMYPVDVADSATHYYVVDPGRYRVVGVNRLTGAIDYTVGDVQGKGETQFAAARAIATSSQGEVYVADTPNNRIQRFNSTLAFLSTWGTKGTAAGQFNQVYGVAVGPGLDGAGQDAEVVYTIDADRVQKFTTTGQWLATFGGGTLSQPRQIDVNRVNGDIYVVSARSRQVVVYGKNLVEKFRFGSQGSGPGQFNGDPRGVTVSRDGTLVFVTDDGGRRVEAFTASGTYLYQMGTASTGTDSFVDPRGIQATDDGRLLVADEWDYALKEYAVDASGATFVRKLFGGAPPQQGVNSPRGLAVNASGQLYVSDWWNQRIVRTDAAPAPASYLSWGQRGTRADPGSLNFAWDVAVQPTTGRVFVANRESHEITVFDGGGAFVTKWGTRGTAVGQLQFPQGLSFAPDGTLWVADSANSRLQRFSIDGAGNGTFVSTVGAAGSAAGQLNMPTGIDVAANGVVWVADTLNNRVQSYNPATGTWSVFTRPGGTGTQAMLVPWGVTVAPDGSIWIADTGRNRVIKMSPTGSQYFSFTGTSAGTTSFYGVFDIEFGGQGQVYISDTWNNRVVQLGWS